MHPRLFAYVGILEGHQTHLLLLSYELSSILSPYPANSLKESQPFPIRTELYHPNGKGASDLPLRLIRKRGLPTFTVRLWGSLLRVNSRFSQADNSLHRGGNSFILPQPQPLQQYHHQIQIQILLFAAYASMTFYNQPSGGIELTVKGAASKAMKFCCGNEYTLVGN